MTRRATLAALGIALAAVAFAWLGTGLLDGPLGMVPGGAFRGSGVPCAAAHWSELAGDPEVQLEVSPRHPRSLTTWSVVLDGALYVPADFLTPWKRWPHQVLADDRIRVRARGRIFECRAARVTDPALTARLREAAARKYDLAPDGRAARTEVWWFRVEDRRAPAPQRSRSGSSGSSPVAPPSRGRSSPTQVQSARSSK